MLPWLLGLLNGSARNERSGFFRSWRARGSKSSPPDSQLWQFRLLSFRLLQFRLLLFRLLLFRLLLFRLLQFRLLHAKSATNIAGGPRPAAHSAAAVEQAWRPAPLREAQAMN